MITETKLSELLTGQLLVKHNYSRKRADESAKACAAILADFGLVAPATTGTNSNNPAPVPAASPTAPV